jgi:hypothetical protein
VRFTDVHRTRGKNGAHNDNKQPAFACQLRRSKYKLELLGEGETSPGFSSPISTFFVSTFLLFHSKRKPVEKHALRERKNVIFTLSQAKLGKR